MPSTEMNRSICFVALLLIACVLPSQQCMHDDSLADMEDKSRLQELTIWCSENCVEEWTLWSRCTKSCGGGKQNRIRAKKEHTWCKDGITKYTLATHCTAMSTNQTQRCNEQCPFGYPQDGECVCGDRRDGNCCRDLKECRYPGTHTNGRVEWTPPALVGSHAIVSCDDGFIMMGNDDIFTCSKDGYWLNSRRPERPKTGPSLCIRIKCTRPQFTGDTRPNLKIVNDNDGYDFGEQVVFKCDDGYEIEGPESRECRSYNETGGRWTGYTPSCSSISCPDPGRPVNGLVRGDTVKFGDTLTFSCISGYKLVGSESLRCMSSGTWRGHMPTCEQIECEAPWEAPHTRVRVQRYGTDTLPKATFTCDAGYTLEGSHTILCTNQSIWSGPEPTCVARNCSNPGEPANGYKDGTYFMYPSEVAFHCQRGYRLVGLETIECQENGRWSGDRPVCEACPLNTWADANGTCVQCHPNSHTVRNACTSPMQCLCDINFSIVEGGGCEEIRCMSLIAPEFASLEPCDTLVGSMCTFTCDDGYIVDHGAPSTECQLDGRWSGHDLSCIPCPMNTYKSSEKVCTPCPRHSHTNAMAQMEEGCICDIGYFGPRGGPCADVDECEENGGRGPCEDSCENYNGSYHCRCTRPGFIVDSNDNHMCFPEHQCHNITVDTAPENGGVVCHYFWEQSSIFCSVKCNYGFEHPLKSNNYETCGEFTNWQWSFQINANDSKAAIQPCIQAFFPEIQLQANTSYFTTECHSLSEVEKAEVKGVFVDTLNQHVCQYGTTKLCDIKRTYIICGRTTRRRRRDTGEWADHTEVDLGLTVEPLKMITANTECGATICERLRIPAANCEELCEGAYNRYIKAAVMYADRKLHQVYGSAGERENMVLRAAHRIFEPAEENTLRSSGLQQECEPGMQYGDEVDGACLPCWPGTYLHEADHTCQLCPIGTYTNQERQTSCKPCPAGFTTTILGATTCHVCDKGSWGVGCSRRCPECIHGTCSPANGVCNCESGYEGTNCDIDIPGCVDSECFPGVECTDVPAPGIGYTCGECPPGYYGDGITCRPTTPMPTVHMWMAK